MALTRHRRPSKNDSQTTPRSGVSPLHVLPAEIWEQVLYSVFPDSALRELAMVCTTFNALSIPILLARSGYREALGLRDLRLCRPYLIATFALCFSHSLSFRRLEFTLEHSFLERDLTRLLGITRRAKELEYLTMICGANILRPYAADRASKLRLMAAFSSVLGAMVEGVSGPVIVLTKYNIFSVRPEDVAFWNLLNIRLQFAPHRSPIDRLIERVLDRFFSGGVTQRDTKVRTHKGRIETAQALISLHTVMIQRIAPTPAPKPSVALVTFDPDVITTLHLSLTHRPFTPHELSLILPALSLPFLVYLTLSTAALDRAALRSLLHRHSGVKYFEYSGTRAEAKFSVRALLDQPLAHPGLRALTTAAHGPCSTGRLLSAFDLSACPQLRDFHFQLMHSPSAGNLAGLVEDLQRLTECTHDVSLHFLLWDFPRSRDKIGFGRHVGLWAAHPDALAVAHALHCVRVVNVTADSSLVEVGQHMLPWLALLPAVREVSFSQRLKKTSVGRGRRLEETELRAQEQAFADEAKEALRGAVRIRVYSIESV